MLCAVFGAYGNTQHHGQLEGARSHCLPLGHLVEHLVAGTADEVAVHKLNYGAAAAHAVAHGRGHNCRLGNRSIEQAVIGDSLGKAAVNRKRAAPIAVFFAVCNQSGILIELVDYCLKNTVSVLIYLVFGNRLAVLVKAEALLACNLLHTGILSHGDKHIGGAVGLHGNDMLIGEHNVGNGITVWVITFTISA